MSKTLVFRGDGNTKIGLGHLYRLLSLAEMVRETYQILFLARTDSIISMLPEYCPVQFVDDNVKFEDEPQWISTKFNNDENLFILDGYQFDYSYQSELKSQNFTLIYVDDLVSEKMVADVVINHALNIKVSDYSSNSEVRFALGPDYAILRTPFLESAKSFKSYKDKNNTIVCFGGADPLDLTSRAVSALLNFSEFKIINVLVGEAYESEKLKYLKDNNPDRIFIHRGVSAELIVKIIEECCFAIASASSVLYELCCVKLPILAGYYAKNQIRFYQGFLNEGAIIGAGDFSGFNQGDFAEYLQDWLSGEFKSNYEEVQAKLIDGKSAKRIKQLINQLNFTYRLAKEDDIWLIYDWSNDPLVRKNSFNSEPITKENHQIWYRKILRDKDSFIYIAFVNNNPAGMVRYQSFKNETIVGLNIDSKFRGQGLGSTVLIKTAENYFQNNSNKIIATIKSDNLASIKTFKNAGYIFEQNTVIKNIPSAIYKLEKRNIR